MSDQHRPCGMSAFAPSGNCWRPSQWNALFSTKTLVGEDFQTTSTQHSPSSFPVPCRLISVGALDVSSMCAAAADLRDPGFMHGVAPGQPAPCAIACRRHPCSLSRCMIICVPWSDAYSWDFCPCCRWGQTFPTTNVLRKVTIQYSLSIITRSIIVRNRCPS